MTADLAKFQPKLIPEEPFAKYSVQNTAGLFQHVKTLIYAIVAETADAVNNNISKAF